MDTRSSGTHRSGLRISNGLLALGSAAVMSIYTAGNLRTREAASRFADDGEGRRRPSVDVDANGVLPTATETTGTETAAMETAATETAATKPAPAAADPSAAPVLDSGARPSGASVPKAPETDLRTVTVGQTASSPEPLSASAVATKSARVKTGDESLAPSTTVSGPTPPVPTPTPLDTQQVAAKLSAPAVMPAPPPSTTPPTAVDSTTTSKPAAETAKVVWRDGTFSGWGTSRHGDIEATIVIEGGRITGASITRCLTRYSCSLIAHLQKQVITRQSPDVDYVSGATQSANAFYYAVLEALKASK